MRTDNRYILMLEDDADDRHITQMFVSQTGHDISVEFLTNANDVIPYLEMCTRTGIPSPDVIILDKNIPMGNSMETLKKIKTHPAFRSIPVIMISGTATYDEVKESYRIGVNSFILKPFNSEQTSSTIGNFINYWFDTVQLPVPGVSTGILP